MSLVLRNSSLDRRRVAFFWSLAVGPWLLMTSVGGGAEPKLVGRFNMVAAGQPKDEGLWIKSINVSDDGKHLAAMDGNGGLSLWDVATGKTERQLEKSLPPTAELSIPHDAKMVYLPGGDSLAVLKSFVSLDRAPRLHLQMWNTAQGKSLHKADVPSLPAVAMPGPMAARPGLASMTSWNRPTISASRNGARLAVGISASRLPADYLKIALAALEAAGNRVPPVPRFIPPSPTIISVFDVAKKRMLTSITTEWGFAPFALSADGKRLAIWDGSTARIAIYDVDRPKKNAAPLVTFAADQCMPFDLTFGADAKNLVVTYRVHETKSDPNGVIRMSTDDGNNELHVGTWETASGKLLHEAKLFMLGGSHQTALSADGQVAAAPAEDKTLRIIDSSNGKERAKLDVPDLGPERQYFPVLSRDGRFVAASTSTGEILVWDLDPGK